MSKKMANYTNMDKAQELWKTLYLCAKESPSSAQHRRQIIYGKLKEHQTNHKRLM
ncbi:hypothetical protein J2S25_001056 [Mesobacillus stamsii]|uniref:Uncharacterized protein n=1 Tax=Mesobacillus stamsii TaxID=225347 RepID=A0ABU0FSH9_9BACI|nr:hypothetical protein [Mesobacillus stamsii]